MIGLKSLQRAALPGIMVLALLSTASQAQQSYPTPEAAAAALAAAVKSGPSDILKVLGKAADEIVSSGDVVADADTRQRFASMYDAKHSIKTEGNKRATLVLGPDDFPFPIPLVSTRTGWEFDADEGRIEILYRRIGSNADDDIFHRCAGGLCRDVAHRDATREVPRTQRRQRQPHDLFGAVRSVRHDLRRGGWQHDIRHPRLAR